MSVEDETAGVDISIDEAGNRAAKRDELADWINGQIEAIIRSDHGDPFAILGMHSYEGAGVEVSTFQPKAIHVDVIDAADGQSVCRLERVHPDGFFRGAIPNRGERFAYRLRLEGWEGTWEIDDPYRFPPVLGDLDVYLLGEGNHLRNYERLGAHPTTVEGMDGVAFAVWAPNARRVSVVGDFNSWDGRVHPMRLRHGIGVWEIFLPGVSAGDRYKFEVRGPQGNLAPLKSDPYAFASEKPPATASVVHGLPRREWNDGDWMGTRHATADRHAPISIYEVHLGSWRRVPEEGGRYLTYAELADQLVPYVQDLGFTHIELLPVSEYPFDGSWGYQPIGLFAPTSRHGGPEDFQAFVERCHQAGIGVLIDWVPGHFPSDAHGLGLFDGTHVYEHADPRQGFHQDWNTLIYNFGRTEVANFLLGNALFWMSQFHIDGLRVDAVASMLYLDYSRNAGEWIPNQYGGNENLEAISLLKRMNEEVFSRFPGATTAAEESTAWPGVSRPTYAGGLGFGFKWNMGWMHDTLRYMSKEAIHRRWHHNDLTFGLLYAFAENFILPLSHDEVVHGKGSMIGKMPGDFWQKFANLRAYYGFMWCHPGKKLLFMGGEFGQWSEWNHNVSLEWHLCEYEEHKGLQAFIRDLNRLYKSLPALHRFDTDWQGFEWIDANDHENSVLTFVRKGEASDHPVLVVCNFTPVVREDFRIGVPWDGDWDVILSSDDKAYGGSGVRPADGAAPTEAVPWHGRDQSVSLTLPPLATVVLQRREPAN